MNLNGRNLEDVIFAQLDVALDYISNVDMGVTEPKYGIDTATILIENACSLIQYTKLLEKGKINDNKE